MKREKLRIAALLLSALTSTNVFGEFYSGTTLFQYLEADLKGGAGYKEGIGTGYVVGVFDSVSGILVCSPDGVTIRQVKQVVFNYMEKRPESWNQSADQSVIAALKQTWPCKKT